MKSSYVSVPVAILSLAGTALLLARTQEDRRTVDAIRRELASRPPADAPLAARDRDGGARAVPPAVGPRAPVTDTANGAAAGIRRDAGAPVTPGEARARFDAIFEKEPTVAAWARERSRTLAARLDAVLPAASTLRSVACHSVVCRVETVHDDAKAASAFIDGAFKRFDTKITTGASFTTTLGADDRGRITIVSYLADEGEPLPDIQVR